MNAELVLWLALPTVIGGGIGLLVRSRFRKAYAKASSESEVKSIARSQSTFGLVFLLIALAWLTMAGR